MLWAPKWDCDLHCYQMPFRMNLSLSRHHLTVRRSSVGQYQPSLKKAEVEPEIDRIHWNSIKALTSSWCDNADKETSLLSSCLTESWNWSSKIVAITKRGFQMLLLHTLGWFFRGIWIEDNKCLFQIAIISLAKWDSRDIRAYTGKWKLWNKQLHFFDKYLWRQLWARCHANC